MKMKSINAPKYIFKDELGDFEFQDVNILVSAESAVTSQTFNQEKDDYSVSSKEIERMGAEAARRFFNEKYAKVLSGEASLSPKEINGIRLFLDCNGTELGALINLDKSNVSRILGDKQPIQRHTMFLMMEKLKNEIEFPGATQAILEKLNKQNHEMALQELKLSPIAIAEWIVRKFTELDENITTLKLQKLLYYAQGIGLGRYNCKLFNLPLLAWKDGPVVKEVWEKYRPGSTPLSIDPKADVTSVQDSELAVKILNETITLFGKYSAWVLRDKTHNERPWLETPRDGEISDVIMKEFFGSLVV